METPEKDGEQRIYEKAGLSDEQFENYWNLLKKNPNRLEEVWKTLDTLIVGETHNKRVLFLNMLSAKLKVPIGTIIAGESSSGKTHIVRETLKLFPECMNMARGGLSKKALLHMRGAINPETHEKIIDLSGKILWFLEESGGEESYEILRPILSRDQEEIVFEVTNKAKIKGSERFVNEVIRIKGCPAFVTTSTRIGRLAETGTRVFTLSPDESKKQNALIVKYKIDKHRFPRREPDLEHFKTFIQQLEPYNVWIPFADLVELNSEKLGVNVRRDIEKIFSIIECSAMFNQEDRPKVRIGGEESVVAKLWDDYLQHYEMILGIIKPTLLNLPKKVLTFYELLKENKLEGFTHKECVDRLKVYSQDTVRNYCWHLVEGGLLTYGHEGKCNVYYLNSLSLCELLPSVTLRTVTHSTVSRSLTDAKQYLYGSVTNLQMNNMDFLDLGLIYTLPVTLATQASFDDTSPRDCVNAVIEEKVTDGNTSEVWGSKGVCKICGLKSLPAVLDADGFCEMCKPEVPR